MINKIIGVTLLLCYYSLCVFPVSAQQKYTVSGYVSDHASGERLIGVNIYEHTSGLGISTNEYGFYSLTLPEGKRNYRFSFIGHQSTNVALNLQSDTTMNVQLLTNEVELDEVKISANLPKVDQTQMSVIDIPIDKLTKVPTIMGEPDVLKVIQLLPGVQSGTEGTSGIYVRGGAPDQNLFLLDGVPVYNASHLFGFFSVFNPGAVKTVKLYKGGFPARYGGRLSSVVDIRMKDGNDQEFSGDVSIGLISSRLNLEGPIVKGKSAFVVSARRTYIDVLAQPLIAGYNKLNDNDHIKVGYFFYDVNAKLNHKFSDRSRLYLSTYLGKDKMYSEQEYSDDHFGQNNDETVSKWGSNLNWGNRIAALRWNYVLNNKLFSNTTLTYSKYNFQTVMEDSYTNLTSNTLESMYEFDYYSNIQDFTAKIDFDYAPHPNHAVKFGVGLTKHYFKPGVSSYTMQGANEDPSVTTTPSNNVDVNEQYAYIEDNWTLSAKLKMNLGLHFSNIAVQGKYYPSVQPRASMRYKVADNVSIKASYAKMVQYVHLLSTSTIDMPTDLWVPITSRLSPPVSHQYALGTAVKLPLSLDLTVEGFYKDMSNLITYKEGASFTASASSNWDDKVEMGRGWAYGAEIMLEKTFGKTSGWIGYTWSKSERQFDNINYGAVFPARYDRRHDLSVVMTHKFSDRFDVGCSWVFNTGNAVTLGAYSYPVAPGLNVDNYWTEPKDYGGRNSYRMPNYHRLDVGMNFHKQKKHGIRTWNISLYNAYSRQNPFMLTWGSDYENAKEVDVYNPESGQVEQRSVYPQQLSQLSLFPLIPSLSYSYKF